MKTKYIILLFAFFVACLTAITPRNEATMLMYLVFVLFVSAFYFAKKINNRTEFLLVIVVIRLPFLLMPPLLSDDYYRFLWDAKVVAEGLSPYANLPSELLQTFKWPELFGKLNSPNYYSVYPPFMQSMFLGAYFISPFLPFYLALKTLCFVLEIVMFRFIYNKLLLINANKTWFCFVALSPLVMIEGLGNLHFEVIMMLLFLAAFIFFKHYNSKRKQILSPIIASVSLLTKLTVAPLFLLFVKKSRRFYLFSAVLLMFSAILLSLFINESALNALQSFGLYFGNFEFNASVFYIVRAIGNKFVGYNIIEVYSDFFKYLLILYILIVFLYKFIFIDAKTEVVHKLLFWFYVLYFFLNPTLHPWYIIVPLFFSILTEQRLWIYWSLTAFLSYYFYQDYAQIGWWLYAEYLSLFVLLLLDKLYYKKIVRRLPHSMGGIQ